MSEMDSQLIWKLARQAGEWAREVVKRLSDSEEQRRDVTALLEHPLPTSEASECEYQRFDLLGRGSHADVYRARHVRLGRDCALKLVHAASGASAEELKREAEKLARLMVVPNVVKVYDMGRLSDGMAFIEMELCADDAALDGGTDGIRVGSSLRRVVDGVGPLLPDEAARIGVALCRGLQAAHAREIVHGDVKPENVLITPIERRPMLADFGIASTLTRGCAGAAGRIGTVAYMAPEQYRADGTIPNQHSDIYMLGGTLFFALTGELPHPDRQKDGHGSDSAPRSVLPRTIPDRLRLIVNKAMATDPARRPSARELGDILEAFIARRPLPSEPIIDRARLLYQRHRAEFRLAAFALVTLVVAILSISVLLVQGHSLKDRATRLKDDVETKEQKLSDLNNQLQQTERELQKKERELQVLPQMKEDLAAAQATRDALRPQLEYERKDRDKERNVVATVMRTAIDDKQKLLDAIQTKLDAVANEGSKVAEENTRLHTAEKLAKDEAERERADRKTAQQTASDARVEAGALRGALQEKSAALSRLEIDVSQLRGRVDALEREKKAGANTPPAAPNLPGVGGTGAAPAAPNPPSVGGTATTIAPAAPVRAGAAAAPPKT